MTALIGNHKRLTQMPKEVIHAFVCASEMKTAKHASISVKEEAVGKCHPQAGNGIAAGLYGHGVPTEQVFVADCLFLRYDTEKMKRKKKRQAFVHARQVYSSAMLWI